MKSKMRFLPLVVAMTLLASLFVMSPASAAVGTVSLDKSFVTTPNGTIEVTVADTDLNAGVLQVDETDDFDSVTYTVPSVATNESFQVRTSKFPILDIGNGSGRNFLDVRVTSTDQLFLDNFTTFSATDNAYHPLDLFSADGGIVTFRNTGAANIAAGSNFTLTYVAADVQTATVKVTSSQDATGFDVRLPETGSDTGSFRGMFNTGAATVTMFDMSGGVDEATVGIDLDGDDLMTSTGVTSTTEVLCGCDLDGDAKATGTTLVSNVNLLLATGFPIRPTIAAVTGAIISVNYNDGGTARIANATVETTRPSVVIQSPGDQTATRTQSTRLITEITDSDSGVDDDTISFVIDSALNVGGGAVAGIGIGTITTNQIPGGFRAEALLTGVPTGEILIEWYATATDNAGNVGESDRNTATVARDNHRLRIDTVAPSYSASFPVRTGAWYDTAAEVVKSGSDADRTFIQVIFNEELDGSTVQASDFRVAGTAPVEANWYADQPSSVFLKVPTLASDALPTVALVNAISDRAGNQVPGGLSTTAVDRIAPTFTVNVTPRLDKTRVTIDVSSDETLLTAPAITVNGTGPATDLTSPSLIGTNLFRSTFDPAVTPMVGNVRVTVTDTSGNARSTGNANATAGSAILFEIDDIIPAPAVQFPGGDAGNVYTQNPFVIIDWNNEGREYGLDAGGAVTTTVGGVLPVLTSDLDSHNMVTLTSVTLNGTDVSARVNREGNARFLFAGQNLAFQEHTLLFTGMDDAGNTREVSQKFTIKVRPPFEVALTPGWNLVSLPAQPRNPGINDVISSTHPIDIVLTYDPTAPGAWLTATRGDDGLFSGTLNQIQARRAYWVHTVSFEALSVPTVALGGGEATVLPTVNLVRGWNLVPILDVTGTKVSGNDLGMSMAGYIGATPARVYRYLPLNDRFEQLTTNPVIGAGYWVYLNAATTLVP